jgi:serine/threonine protein kinase
MASSLQKKNDPSLRLVSDEEGVVYPEGARTSDESPTVISKTVPLVESSPSSQNKKLETGAGSPESVVEGLRGRKLAHFELIAPIGVGGMAAVLRARDTQLDRIVALKILPPEMAKEQENIDRFHQEAKAAARLDHANIARVFHYGEDQSLHFIAFEFVEGINLRNMLERRGQLPVAEAVRYIIQIATGLEHAASRGVVHRDVKPSNIIITPQGQAKLVDMGLARNLERRGERDLTQSGMTLGTFDYISPEQALEPRDADVRSDIYSLGCTLYHLLTGQPPVPDGTPAKKLDFHQNHEPMDPRSYNPEIPDAVVKVLGKMMAKNPKDRYQRPSQVVHELMQMAQLMGGAEGMPEVVLFTDMPAPSEPGRRPMLYIGLALAALVVMIGILSLIGDPTPNTTTNPAKPGGDAKGVAPMENSGTPPKTPADDSKSQLPAVVRNPIHLKTVLDAANAQLTASIGQKVELKSEGLVFKGTGDQKLEVKPDDEQQHQIVSFDYLPDGSAFGLSLEGGKEITFRRIKFVINSDLTPDRVAAGLAVRGARKVTFDQCIFVQNIQPFVQSADIMATKLVPMASLLVAGAGGVKPQVELRDCYFYGGGERNTGQVAVAVDGDADVTVTSTAFRPHSAFVSFRDKCTLEATALKMERSTGFVEMGPAFRFTSKAGARLDVSYSVFARPGGGNPPGTSGQSDLIYFAGAKLIQYEGRYNLYHNLNALVESKPGLINELTKFQGFLAEEKKGADIGSQQLELASHPLLHAANALAKPIDDVQAFQLNRKYYKEYGLKRTWTGSAMEPPPVPIAKAVKKVVDIESDDSTSVPGVKFYRYLQSALGEAEDGDVIYIKHPEGAPHVEVRPVDLKPNRSVTLKPEKDCDPILVFDKTVNEKESWLFKIQKSKLQIEQMKIHVIAPTSKYDLRTVVQAGDAAHLVFKNCAFLMRTGHPDGKTNLVTFFDPDPVMMKSDTPSAPPRLEFHECFIRGKGDLVALHGCRRLNVDIDASLIALDGSVLDIDAGTKEMPLDEGVQWNMMRSTVLAKKSIFNLRAGASKGLTVTRAKVRDCLLAALTTEAAPPVVALDKGELKKYLSWDGGHNFYGNFFDPQGDDLVEWKQQVTEVDPKVGKITFSPKLDEGLQALREPAADLFKPAEIAGFGMPPEMQRAFLPLPPDPEP